MDTSVAMSWVCVLKRDNLLLFGELLELVLMSPTLFLCVFLIELLTFLMRFEWISDTLITI